MCSSKVVFKCYYLGQSVMMQKTFYDQYYTILLSILHYKYMCVCNVANLIPLYIVYCLS